MDNDFLSFALNEESFLDKLMELVDNDNVLVVDYFVRFEFLRDVFIPQQIFIKEDFVSKFEQSENHSEVIKKLQENAIVLSKIYSHQKQKNNSKNSPSLTDLFLAARLASGLGTTIIATGNIKDFPPFLFDVIGVWNVLLNDGGLKSFAFLEFNRDKYKKCVEDLEKLENI